MGPLTLRRSGGSRQDGGSTIVPHLDSVHPCPSRPYRGRVVRDLPSYASYVGGGLRSGRSLCQIRYGPETGLRDVGKDETTCSGLYIPLPTSVETE